MTQPKITTEWHDEAHTIIHSCLYGQMTWPVFNQGIDEAFALAQSVTHDVYLVTHFQDGYAAARGNAFPHIGRFFRTSPANLKQQVMVGTNLLDRILLNTYITINGSKIDLRPDYTDTLPEAIQLIEQLKQQA